MWAGDTPCSLSLAANQHCDAAGDGNAAGCALAAPVMIDAGLVALLPSTLVLLLLAEVASFTVAGSFTVLVAAVALAAALAARVAPPLALEMLEMLLASAGWSGGAGTGRVVSTLSEDLHLRCIAWNTGSEEPLLAVDSGAVLSTPCVLSAVTAFLREREVCFGLTWIPT